MHLSLTLSKKLAAVVTIETYHYHCSDLGEATLSRNCAPFAKATCGEHTPIPSHLSEWAEVFKALDRKLEWWKGKSEDGADSITVMSTSTGILPVWKVNFTWFCELAATDWKLAQDYSEGLL